MEKNEELLERLVNEIAAQNKFIALLIAKNNVSTFDKSDTEILEEMKSETESIIKWSYFSSKESFPLNSPEKSVITFDEKLFR